MKRLQIWLIGLFLVVPCVGKGTVSMVVSTYDGLVIAADSRVTLKEGNLTRPSSDYGQKVVRVGTHVAVTYSGTAYLYNDAGEYRSISSIIEAYRSRAGIVDTARTQPNAVAVGLDSLLMSFYQTQRGMNIVFGPLEMVVCGYNKKGEREIINLTYSLAGKDSTGLRVKNSIDTVYKSGITGSIIRGQNDVYSRLIKGIDPAALEYEQVKIAKVAVDPADSSLGTRDSITARLNLDSFRYDVRYDLMTLQDAIDFAVFIIRATIEAQRFNQKAVQGVGGDIDIAVITQEGFQWIQQKVLGGESRNGNR